MVKIGWIIRKLWVFESWDLWWYRKTPIGNAVTVCDVTQGELPHMVCTKTIQNVPFSHSNNWIDFLFMKYYGQHIFTCLPIYKNICSTIRFDKMGKISQMCTQEMGKFSLYYITHHGRIANRRISIPLVISTFKNSYLFYLLSDLYETFTIMFLWFFSIHQSQISLKG